MFSTPRVKRDAYEMVHVWPKVAETERFINYQHPPISVHGNVYTNYEDVNLAPMQSRRRSRYFSVEWWYLEILALAVSIASFVAIVIVLRIYEGRAVSELGLPKTLTLNAIIAALATVSRATLMVPVAAALIQDLWLYFAKEAEKTTCSSRLSDLDVFDSASRGTWGSLLVLFRFPRRVFAFLAALVTILSLIFGTFIQQSVAYDKKVALSSGSPFTPDNIPRAETWTNEHGRPSEGYLSPPLNFIAALYEGALREDAAAPPVSCPSGNCTWPSTPSLAICGDCVPSKPSKVVCYQHDVTEYYCNYTMPSGVLMQMWNFDKYQDPPAGVGFQVVPSSGAHFAVSEGDRAYFANFDLMGTPYTLNTYGVHNNDMKAAECALWMCVQTYNTSVNVGIQTQTVVSRIDDLDIRELAYTGWFPGEDLQATFPALPASEDPQNSTSFIVDAAALFALRWYFNDTLKGNVTFSQEIAAPTSDLVHGIWNGTKNLDSWIANVAKSVTGVIRTTETISRPEYNGTAHAMGVNIRWLWLLLPLTLIASSSIVLLATIARTAVSSVEAWKGSPLTFLLFGIDPRIRDEAYGHGLDHHGFRKAVGANKVRLQNEGGTFWKFKAS